MEATTASANSLAPSRLPKIITIASIACVGAWLVFQYLAEDFENEPLLLDPVVPQRSNAIRRVRRRTFRTDNTDNEPPQDSSDSSSSEPSPIIPPPQDTFVQEAASGWQDTDTLPPNDPLTNTIPLIHPSPEQQGPIPSTLFDPEQTDTAAIRTLSSPPRTGQNIVGLLFRVSEDNARRNAYIHRGCMCNGCGVVPIRGIRYRCANCADFDLCETCESMGMHFKTHVFYKVRIPAPPFGPRNMQSVWYPGDPETCLRQLPKSVMARLSSETGYERPELEAFWEQWTFIANTEWRDDPYELCLAMDRKTFERCLVPSGGYRHVAPNLIHDRMFAFYDTNHDDLIGFAEFLHGISYRKKKDKLAKIFQGYDMDNDGLVCRKDFLRVFRAYYVLYKEMHQDILECLDAQTYSTPEVQQLVSGRQPLSSYFGRDGRVPTAGPRPPVTRKAEVDGELMVADDDAGVTRSNEPMNMSRAAFFDGLLDRKSADELGEGHPWGSWSDDSESEAESDADHSVSTASIYVGGLLNPPRRVSDLPALLQGNRPDVPTDATVATPAVLDAILSGTNSRVTPTNLLVGSVVVALQPSETARASDEVQPSTEQVNAAPRATTAADGDEPTAAQVSGTTADAPRKRRRTLDDYKAWKQRAIRGKVFDRWQRRQFYLDEEEGGTAPDGWGSDADVLVNGDVIGNGKAVASGTSDAPFAVARSRSSSKVRFAEDADDIETRSNHSASSRSVPERWGGMDIPDAERDTGKEILYQVTQQAFNELLDVLFKDKEDLAVKAACTKAQRDLHRPLFESISPEVEEVVEEAKPTGWTSSFQQSQREASVKDAALEELLQVSGYSVDPALAVHSPGEQATDDQPSHATADANVVLATPRDEDEDKDEDDDQEPQPEPEPKPDEDGLISARHGVPGEWEPIFATNTSPAAAAEIAISLTDPTMPQFRPNSNADLPAVNVTSGNGASPQQLHPDDDPSPRTSRSGPSSGKSRRQISRDRRRAAKQPRITETPQAAGLPEPISQSTLREWKQLDLAEEEAKKRSGWGRLTLEEFEAIWRKEGFGANRLDYLGTWIDFCIP